MHFNAWFFLLFTICTSNLPLPANEADIKFNTTNEEEALFVRRIIEFYQEEEKDLFLNQAHKFLKKHSKSPLCSDLCALLGDYYMQSKEFDKACVYFDKIKGDEVKEKIIVNYLQALHNLQDYSKSTELASKYLDKFLENDTEKHNFIHFFYAKALYRGSLDTNAEKENKTTMALDAIKEFESLLPTKLSIQAMKPLAHLYYLFKKFSLSSNTYKKLSEKDPENKEFYLFQAATVESNFDKETAIKTFNQVCDLNSDFVHDAAYNSMVLLYESENYSELIQIKDKLESLLDDNKKPLLNFFLGKSHLKREDYQRAESALQEFLKTEGFLTEHKNALLSLALIAQKNEDTKLFHEILEMFKKSYKEDREYFDLLFAAASVSKKQKDYLTAESLLEEILKLDIEKEQKLNVEFEYARILFLNKKWIQSRQCFENFFKKNKDHSNNLAALHLLLTSSSELANSPNSEFSKKDFCNDLKEVLKQKCLKNTSDEQKYRFLLAKTYFELNMLEKAIKTLKPILSKCNSRSIFTEALVLNGYCLKQLSYPTLEYVKLFEKALEVNPQINERGKIHLILYNAFAKLSDDSKKELYTEKAANHLYEAYLLKEDILRENLIWASNYFSKKNKDYEKSIKLLESAISLKDFSISAVEIEDEIVKLTEIYQKQNDEDKQTELLDKLENEYLKNPQEKWKHIKNVRFELAKKYERKEQFEKAISYYDNTFKRESSLRGFIQAKSCLQSARLTLSLIKNNFFKKNNPKIVKVINQLKDLTIQKSLDNEPIHLEAAIEYIELLCKVEKLSDNSSKKLSLLKNIQKTFFNTDTIIDKEYHKKRAASKAQNLVFELYMKFIENEILLCENFDLNAEKVLESLNLLNKETELSEFLKIRIQKQIRKLQVVNNLKNTPGNES